jgi:hypothetical protein
MINTWMGGWSDIANSGVEAPAWQSAEALEYRDISALWQRRQAGCSGA